MKKHLLILCLGLLLLPAASCNRNIAVREESVQEPLFSTIGQHVLPEKRMVEMTCRVTVSGIPAGAKRLQVWIPFPGESTYQQRVEPTVESPTSFRPVVRYDSNYTSPMLFVSGTEPLPGSFDISYTVRIHRTRIDDTNAVVGELQSPEEFRKFFAPDLLSEAAADRDSDVVEIMDTGRKPSAKQAVSDKDRNDPLADFDAKAALAEIHFTDQSDFARARAIYDFVLGVPTEPTAEEAAPKDEGEGEKDVASALDAAMDAKNTEPASAQTAPAAAQPLRDSFYYARKMAQILREAGIPARVVCGVLLPEDRSPDGEATSETAAWVRFYVNGFGWSAADPYAAAKYPELRDYMFRGLCANRVALSMGPWPGLVPVPETDRPRYFTRAVAEADGKPVMVDTAYTFRDVAGGSRP